MNKFYARRLLSLLIVVMLVFPVMSFASGNDDVKIKSVYFQDEGGNMVFVDFEEAISKHMSGEGDLYLAIQDHVGKAELKGRPLYLQTSNGRLLDYGMAMKDNVFILKAILETNKYDMEGKVNFTHELKLVDGVVKIVPYEKPVDPTDPTDPEPEIVNLVSVGQVSGITVELGTGKVEAIGQLSPTTTIVDSNEEIHTVDLKWQIKEYNGDIEGEYNAVGRFDLPKAMANPENLKLNVKAVVKVVLTPVEPPVKDFPGEVEDVFVGQSHITNQTYANIRIKDEYLPLVKVVYIDNIAANQIEDELSQWRITVEDGTTIESLKGRVSLDSDVEVIDPKIYVEFMEDSLLGEGFGLGKILVNKEFAKDYPNASQFAVLYCVGDSDTTLVLSDMVNLGESTKDLVQYIEDMNVITIGLYDVNGNLIKLIHNVMGRK